MRLMSLGVPWSVVQILLGRILKQGSRPKLCFSQKLTLQCKRQSLITNQLLAILAVLPFGSSKFDDNYLQSSIMIELREFAFILHLK